eukprot:scaffold16355_cov170-Amphora_coffeaeformis.AAC.6
MLAKKFAKDSSFAPPLQGTNSGRAFLDRNPETFPFVLDYLRNGCRLVYEPTVTCSRLSKQTPSISDSMVS